MLLSVLLLFGYNTGNCTVQQPNVQNGVAIAGVKQNNVNPQIPSNISTNTVKTQQPAQSNGLLLPIDQMIMSPQTPNGNFFNRESEAQKVIDQSNISSNNVNTQQPAQSNGLSTIDQMIISTPAPNGNFINIESEAQKVIDRIYILLCNKINEINTKISKTFNINHFKQYNNQLIQTLVNFAALLKDNKTINETPDVRYKALKEAAISICGQYLNQCDDLLKNTNAITWFKYNKRNLYSLQSTISGLQFALGKLPQEKNGLTQLNSQYWLELSKVLE